MPSTLPLSPNATHSARSLGLPDVRRFLAGAEENVAAWALVVMMLLPLAEILVRRAFITGIPGAAPIVQHLTLWVGFLGAALAARDDRLLAVATGAMLPDRLHTPARVFSAALTVAILTMLFWGALQLIDTQKRMGTQIALHLPVWAVQVVLPIAFAAIGVRAIAHASPTARGRLIAASGAIAGMVLLLFPSLLTPSAAWIALGIVMAAGLAGAPIFAVLGGAAVLLFLAAGTQPVAVLIETYSLTVSPTLPAIPLFTLAGFVLAEGNASHRLLRLFRAWFGWIPGGTAVVTAVLCSFFTVFTGGSGVTILALGGLLFPALLRDGYRERFGIGLLTASGSLGLLLPPALPLIVYAVVAMIPVEDLFRGGLLPGLMLTAMVAGWGVREGLLRRTPRTVFRMREALAALRAAKWEALMPLVVIAAIFSGWATPIEAAAVTAFYALVTQAGIHGEISMDHGLRRVLCNCAAVVGGVLIILGVAVGLTNYLITADIPGELVRWTGQHIQSRTMFLLALNGFLLAVGCLMDIFSATIVVVPLIVPLGAIYGIDPVHLGIIFIANLELGYLTPPVGLNLFLASYRFERPLTEVFRAVVPMLIILAIGVLVITYVPWLTTCLLSR
jgi:tripartite ATP-independent transporter DctM subunit